MIQPGGAFDKWIARNLGGVKPNGYNAWLQETLAKYAKELRIPIATQAHYFDYPFFKKLIHKYGDTLRISKGSQTLHSARLGFLRLVDPSYVPKAMEEWRQIRSRMW